MTTVRTIPLPSPELYYPASGVSVVTALRERRSQHAFAPGALSLTALGTLLNESAGVTELFGRGTPSPGRAYPVACVVAACAVEGVPPAFYRYDARGHALSPLGLDIAPREWLTRTLANRAIAETEAAHVFAVGEGYAAEQHFGPDAQRFLMLEAGQLIQSMLLVAQHQKIGACTIGRFDRAEADALLATTTAGGSVLHSAAFGRLP
ncbi:SagB/ThcOx family dehydrogenase [Leifsonia sp. NPDC058194]|uniref:SagB/ThcOx family dehydrogenase n=1 Tax=Leifsonia sp. NPDC058194 TaxID=3346374 RepID=UPI0036DE6C00